MGELAASGANIERAIIWAAEQVNEAGGVAGRQVEIIARDSNSTVARGMEAARQLIEDERVIAIIGPQYEELAKAMMPLINEHRVLVVSGGVTSPLFTALDTEGYWFRTTPTAAAFGSVLADAAHADGVRRLAILFVSDEYGRGFGQAVRSKFEAFDGTERVAGVWDELKEMETCRFNESDSGEWELDRCWPEDLEPEAAMFHMYGDEQEKCQNTWDAESCATVYAELETEASGETLEDVTGRDRDGDGEADLNAVILIGLWPLFAYDSDDSVNAIPSWTEAMRTGNLHTISYDTSKFQIGMARDGLIDAMVGQKYWGWGYDVVQMVYDELQGDGDFDPNFTDSGEDIVCPNNCAAMDNMWSSGDFNQELPACELLD